MREEVNQKIVNDKRVKYLKAMRVTAMEKYSKFRQELNQYQLINHEWKSIHIQDTIIY